MSGHHDAYDITSRILMGDPRKADAFGNGAWVPTRWYLIDSVHFFDPSFLMGAGYIRPFDGSPGLEWPADDHPTHYDDDIPPNEDSTERLARHYGKALASLPAKAMEARYPLSVVDMPRTVERLADLTRRVRDHCAERVHTAATSRRIQEDQRRYHDDHDDLRPFEDVSRVLRWVVSWNRRMGVVDRAFDAAVADMRRAP